MRVMAGGTVDLIATDPPFNKGRDFHASPESLTKGAKFQDRWRWEDLHQEWIDRLEDDQPRLMEAIQSARHAHSAGMGAFMCFQAVRLLEMHRLLKPDGSLFLHCDPTASHYIKACLDAIFGQANFRNEIIWRRTAAPNTSYKALGKVHDVIFWYSKGEEYFYEQAYLPKDDSYLSNYSHVEEKTGRRYQLTSLLSPAPRPNLRYEFLGVVRDWRWTKQRMEQAYREGRIVQARPGNVPRYKRYLDEQPGPRVVSVWDDIKRLEAASSENIGFPTQKPLALYERIIQMASEPGDIVLDPFAGCATTCVAAERLGRKWVGIDIWGKVAEVVKERVAKEQIPLLYKDITFTNKLPRPRKASKPSASGPPAPDRYAEPRTMSRQEMKEFLIAKHGLQCQGCDRTFDIPDYLQLDHITPRSEGGLNHISNRTLLCGPCNVRKSNVLTLTGLRRLNKKQGLMAKPSAR